MPDLTPEERDAMERFKQQPVGDGVTVEFLHPWRGIITRIECGVGNFDAAMENARKTVRDTVPVCGTPRVDADGNITAVYDGSKWIPIDEIVE